MRQEISSLELGRAELAARQSLDREEDSVAREEDEVNSELKLDLPHL